MINKGNSPEDDEFELSVFGNGNGESVVLHLGNKRWAIIDSFQTHEKLSVPLEYIRQCSGDNYVVEFVLATHWHNDHVKGISEILADKSNPTFFQWAALSTDVFAQFISLVNQRNLRNMNPASEYLKIYDLLSKKGQITKRKALFDRVLFKSEVVEIKALSPSDKAIDIASVNMINKIEKFKFSRNIGKDDENVYSVVVWVSMNDMHLLLGSDLIVLNDPDLGWSGIHKDFSSEHKALVFKIPHHGSKNAHHEGIWNSLISENVDSIVTSYNKGRNSPPTGIDIERLTKLSRNLYHIQGSRKKINRDRFVEKVIEENTYNNKGFFLMENQLGQVRLRRKFNDQLNVWKIEITPGSVKQYTN